MKRHRSTYETRKQRKVRFEALQSSCNWFLLFQFYFWLLSHFNNKGFFFFFADTNEYCDWFKGKENKTDGCVSTPSLIELGEAMKIAGKLKWAFKSSNWIISSAQSILLGLQPLSSIFSSNIHLKLIIWLREIKFWH